MIEELKYRLIEALKEGLFISVKWGILIALIVYFYNFSMQTRQAAINGEQAALAMRMMQEKGYLPQFVNGVLPDKK